MSSSKNPGNCPGKVSSQIPSQTSSRHGDKSAGWYSGLFDDRSRQTGTTPLWMWLLQGAALTGLACTLAWFSSRFGYHVAFADLPALPLAAGLVLAGLVYIPLPWLIRGSTGLPLPDSRKLLMLIIGIGIVMRVALLWSEPALEDDYQRYMWDGAVTAHGFNPYKASPSDARHAVRGTPLRNLVDKSGVVHKRINHPRLKTIYPPVTQGAFALAHLIKPWSLVAWRLVCLMGEAATLVLLLALLREVGRSSLWVAIYWWNPIVVKELVNSAHMEAIVMPFVLGALLLAIKRRFLFSTGALGLAMGAKLWPAFLAPLIWRQLFSSSLLTPPRRPWLLAACVIALGAMAALWVAPVLIGGIDAHSGFVAYAQRWKTGSALFPVVSGVVSGLFDLLGLPASWSALGARAGLAALLGLVVVWLSVRPIDDARDLMIRVGLVVTSLLFLSPSQFPWYFVWLLPFLCFMPSIGLLAITVTIPLYYTAFYYIALDQKEFFRSTIVWFIWVPIWVLLAGEIWWRATAWRRWDAGVVDANIADAGVRNGTARHANKLSKRGRLNA